MAQAHTASFASVAIFASLHFDSKAGVRAAPVSERVPGSSRFVLRTLCLNSHAPVIVPNVTSMTAAARQKGCSRSTIYYAVKRGLLNTVHVGTVEMVVRDGLYEAYAPRETGLRARRTDEDAGLHSPP